MGFRLYRIRRAVAKSAGNVYVPILPSGNQFADLIIFLERRRVIFDEIDDLLRRKYEIPPWRPHRSCMPCRNVNDSIDVPASRL